MLRVPGRADDSPRQWIMALGHGAAKLDEHGVRGKNDYTDRVIRDKRFKVWVGTDRKISALYDLQEDPLEQHNLLDNDRPDVVAVLKKFQAVVDDMPARDARPQYRPRQPLPWDKKYDPAAESRGKPSKRAAKGKKRQRRAARKKKS